MDSKENIQWPGWETVRLIGRGSFGAVYEIQRDVFGVTGVPGPTLPYQALTADK